MKTRHIAWGTVLALGLAACAGDLDAAGIGKVESGLLAGPPLGVPLPPPGSEACNAINADALMPILSDLASARTAVGWFAGRNPAASADAQAMFDRIGAAEQAYGDSVTNLRTNSYDASNPSVAASLQWQVKDQNEGLLAAAQIAARVARATGSPDAVDALNILSRTTLASSVLGVQAGRCFFDKYANLPDSWWDWTQGKQPDSEAQAAPPLPVTCADLNQASLAPFGPWLEDTVTYEEAELGAFGDQPQAEYAQFDIGFAQEELGFVNALRDQLHGGDASSVDDATHIQTALSTVASRLMAGAMEASYIGTDLPGPSRYAFETDVSAMHYALGLAAVAGQCAATPQP